MRTLLRTILICALALTALNGDQQFPRPTGLVNDFAGVLGPDYVQALTALAREVKQKTGAEIAVATVKTVGDEDYTVYANKLYEAWGVGQKGKDNGVLFLVALTERKFRIEVGYGLEGVLPDAVCAQIRDQLVIPQFKLGDYGRGLWLGVQAAAQRIAREKGVTLHGPSGQRQTRQQRYPARRGGAGSTILKILFGIFLIYMFIRHPRLLLLMLLMSGRGGRGGWSGGGGGFGGGFGGFGGGSSGGGGAGGGW